MLFFLVPLAIAVQQSHLGTFDDPNKDLRSAGIRGTIDPGGYSASAEIKSRTEFFQQLADLQVSALRSLWDDSRTSNNLRLAPAKTGIDAMKNGDFKRAVASLEKLAQSRDDYGSHQLLALAYEGDGQVVAAAEQFRIAAKTHPDGTSAFVHGVALLVAGEVMQAETIFKQGSKGSDTAAVLNRLGLAAAQFQRGEVRQAFIGFMDAALTNPQVSAPFVFIAITVRAADPVQVTRCIAMLESLLRMAPANATAHYALSRALSAQAASQDSETDQLKIAIELRPHFADAHFQLAEIYAQNGALATAITEYKTALEYSGPWPQAHYRLAQLYMRSGEAALAKEEFSIFRQTEAQQKSEIESGKLPIRFLDENGRVEPDESK